MCLHITHASFSSWPNLLNLPNIKELHVGINTFFLIAVLHTKKHHVMHCLSLNVNFAIHGGLKTTFASSTKEEEHHELQIYGGILILLDDSIC